MRFIQWSFEMATLLCRRIRAFSVFLESGLLLKSIGVHCKIRGLQRDLIGRRLVLGDFCWIESVGKHGKYTYTPKLFIGDNVSMSDFVHISCVQSISIGQGTLLGSHIYIGDHSHGSYQSDLNKSLLDIPPALRPLGDMRPVSIGANCWIGDNVVVLAGATIGKGCIVGASSVVKGSFPDYCVIAGTPARIVKELSK